MNTFIILDDSSPSAKIATLHLGTACKNQTINTMIIALLLIDKALYRWYKLMDSLCSSCFVITSMLAGLGKSKIGWNNYNR